MCGAEVTCKLWSFETLNHLVIFSVVNPLELRSETNKFCKILQYNKKWTLSALNWTSWVLRWTVWFYRVLWTNLPLFAKVVFA